MGAVVDVLVEKIQRAIDLHGLVVWFDPDGHWQLIAPTLRFRDAPVECYEASFFELRRRIEPYLSGEKAPRLVLYVPMDEDATGAALCEATAAGVVMKPKLVSARN